MYPLPIIFDGLALSTGTIQFGASKGPCRPLGGLLESGRFSMNRGLDELAAVGDSAVGAGWFDVIAGGVRKTGSAVEVEAFTVDRC